MKQVTYEKYLDIQDFIEEAQKISEYLCLFCQGVFLDPHIDNCSHIFCYRCIEKSLQTSQICPISKTEITSIRKAGFLKNIIDRQTIKCPNKGCEWQGKVIDYENHIHQQCSEYLHKCKYEGCNLMMKKEKIREHVNSCEYRAVNCKFCQILLPLNSHERHFVNCEKYFGPCKNKCGIDVDRKNMENHIKYGCLNTTQNCIFQKYGCHVMFMKKDNQNHMKEHSDYHNFLIIKFNENFYSQLDNEIVKFLVKNQIKNIREKLDNIHIKIENLNRILKDRAKNKEKNKEKKDKCKKLRKKDPKAFEFKNKITYKN